MVDDGRTTRMDDGPWLYYKLTNEPKGSGELNKGICSLSIKANDEAMSAVQVGNGKVRIQWSL